MYDNLTSAALEEKATQLVAEIDGLFDKCKAERRDLTRSEAKQVDRKQDELDRVASLIESRRERKGAPAIAFAPSASEPRSSFPAAARGSLQSEMTYRPDKTAEVSFVRDLVNAPFDSEARSRLDTNRREAEYAHGWDERQSAEYRTMQNLTTQGSEFVPPLYLADVWVQPATGLRPFADALPQLPLPPTGTSISIPKLSSGVAVAARSDAAAVSSVDGVSATVSSSVNEISGLVDIGRQALMRSDPGLDQVILQTLRRRYDAYLDTQLLSGSGTAPQHRGLDNVSSPQTETYTAATPTSATFLARLYSAISKVASARKGDAQVDLIVMHPRRSAWANQSLSSTVPLFQQGQLVQAVGTQDAGFAQSLGGIPILTDANIGITYGAGTSEDHVYLLARDDFILMEGPIMSASMSRPGRPRA